MRLNRTSEWKVMTIWISREVPSFNFKRLDILCLQIGHPFEKIGPFEFRESFTIYYAPESEIRVTSYDHLNFSKGSVVQFRGSQYIMRLNRTSEWKVMTIWISRGHSMFNFKRLDILCPRIVYSCEKLWLFEFIDRFRCSIPSVMIYYVPESDIRVISYDHLNFSRGSVVQFRASRYIKRLNRTSVWKVMTIWISREPL